MSNVTTAMQDESESLLRKLEAGFFWAQDDSDASAAVASPTGDSYESEAFSSDGDAPAALCVDLGTSLEHSRAWER